jgi:hypothetical protein
MDDEDGENHVFLGAKIVGFFGGKGWEEFNIAHSRFWTRKYDIPMSRLCIADKLAITLHPAKWYVKQTRFTGEILEYKSVQKHVDEVGQHKVSEASIEEDLRWLFELQKNMTYFCYANQEEAMLADSDRGRGPK